MKRQHHDDPLFYFGVVVLGVPAYLVPALLGLDKMTSFVLAVLVMLIYTIGFTMVSEWVDMVQYNAKAEAEKKEKEKDA